MGRNCDKHGTQSARAVAAGVTCALLLLLQAGSAWADADEASLHAHLVGGAARLGDDSSKDTPIVPIAGLAGRFTFTRSDYWAPEVRLTLLTGTAARYRDVTLMADGNPVAGDLERTTRLGRLDLGVTARLGVRNIPTFHAGIGGQARWRGPGTINIQGIKTDVTRSELGVDLVAVAGLGYDHRFTHKWIAGFSVEGVHAVTFGAPAFDSVEAFVHLSAYWYPRSW